MLVLLEYFAFMLICEYENKVININKKEYERSNKKRFE